MTQYLVIYEPRESGCFPSLKTAQEIRAMIPTAQQQEGHLRIYRIRRGKRPELLRLCHSSKAGYWLEDYYGNYIEGV